MQYLRTRRLVLILAAVLLAAAFIFSWARNRTIKDSGLHLPGCEMLATGLMYERNIWVFDSVCG
jgi:hypothetical protein